MPRVGIEKRLVGEFIGSAGLLLIVVGSGIMAEKLAGGNMALALLANAVATGAGLFALIQTFGEISGSHFNPAVSFVEFLWKRLTFRECLGYALFQILGSILGVLLAHGIFGLKLFQLGSTDRGAMRFTISELIATFGLITVIALAGKKSVDVVPMTVALYVTSAYWCTSSTSFANPAVTIARSFTSTFSGILWTGVPAFIGAQMIGALLAFFVSGYLLAR
jgi:glycerol uptake facilitator-like aquaporin